MHKSLIFFSLIFILSSSIFANIPKNLQGTWKLDRPGTSEMYRNSPDWNAKKERYLGDIIDYIGQYTFIFKENKIERHYYREILTWDLNSAKQDNTIFTFDSKDKEGKDHEVQITRMSADVIHIKIGTENQYRLCAWKRQMDKPKKEITLPSLEERLKKMMEDEGRTTSEI